MLAEGDKWTKKYLLSWGLFVHLIYQQLIIIPLHLERAVSFFLSMQSLNSYLFVGEINEQLKIIFLHNL